MNAEVDNGITSVKSPYSVDETTRRIEALLRERGLTIFGVVDHSGEALRVGLEMRPTKLVLFGSPTAGTPVMVASPSVALDLPLKALVAEDSSGAVWVSFNSPEYLQRRHQVPRDLIGRIAGAGALLQVAVS